MKGRDQQRSADSFGSSINFRNQWIAEEFLVAESFHRIEARPQKTSRLCMHCVQRCIFRYSRGDDVRALKSDVLQWVEAMEMNARVVAAIPAEPATFKLMYTRLELDNVYDALTMLAFAVALKFTATEMQRVLDAIGRRSEDALIDEAAKVLGDRTRTVAAASKFPKVYAGLLDVWRSAPEARAAKLSKFMEQWKRNIKPIYWSNSLEGAEGAYFGYWAFDVALAAMVLGIDDTALRTNPYYPADLVDAARAG